MWTKSLITKKIKIGKLILHSFQSIDIQKIDNLDTWKNYVIVAWGKVNLELDALVIHEQLIFIQF